jgi:hypothetical protein
MSALTMIQQAQSEGVRLSLSDAGTIQADGDEAALGRWSSSLRTHREEIIAELSAPMLANDESAIRAWLTLIGETDPATIAEVINQCQADAGARAYFTGRAAAELPPPDPDDRHTCDQCANLSGRRCIAAGRGEIVASRNYEPIRDLLRRCEGFTNHQPDERKQP